MTAPRPDVRLEDAPMQAVSCGACGAEVTARKSSWDQTSLQWTGEALRRCLERRSPPPAPHRTTRPNADAFTGCAALRDSVRVAAVSGHLDVQSDEPLPTRQEDHP